MDNLKRIRRKILYILPVFLLVAAFLGSTAPAAYAAPAPTSSDVKVSNCDNVYFLTFPAWYRGLTKTGTCEVKKLVDKEKVNANKEINITNFLTVIGLNAADILLQAIMYGAAAFLIIGGFKYITSQGNSSGVVAAKKTIMNALIGMVIGLLGSVIVNAIFAYIGAGSYSPDTPPSVSSATILGNILSTVYTAAGIVAVFSLVIAGISYSTSAGDASKVQTAKSTILYSVIGLAVIILAFAITSFVTGGIS